MKGKIITISPAGFWTEFETPELNDRHALLESLPRFEDELLEAGYAPASGPAPIAGTSAQSTTINGHASFLVDSITATVADGKAYWRVRGGEYQKWGVIVYPEVLEAAGLGKLNPLEPFVEVGMIAHYSTKPDGKPKKVIRLERK